MEKNMTVDEMMKHIEKTKSYLKEKIKSGDCGSETFDYVEEFKRLSNLYDEIDCFIREY